MSSGEIAAEVIYQDELVFAIRDIRPQAPFHALVIPREHIQSSASLEAHHRELLSRIFAASRRLAESEGFAADGYRLVLNTGEHGGQTVPHLHMHVLGGRPLGWPPG